MAHFNKFAYELQFMILAQCDRSSLHTMSLVCHDLRILSNQFLYTDIDWRLYYSGGQLQRPPLALFLRTLIECPRLASLVRRFRLDVDEAFNDGFKYMNIFDGGRPKPLEPPIFDTAMKLIYHRGFPDKGRWRAALRLGRVDALIALILSQLDRLEELDLGMCLVHKSVYVGIAMSRLIMRRHDGFFSRLKKIKFAKNVQGFEAVGLKADINQIVPCFYLPSLKELDISFSDTWSDWPEFKKGLRRKPTNSLTTLRLYRCDLTPEFIGKFVSLAPAIKVLHCGILRDEWDFEEAEHRMHFADLRSALLPTAGTLEQLTIDVVRCEKHCDAYAPINKTGKIPMGSLRPFQALRSLELPTALLLGETPWHSSKQLSDLLPRNIQYLTLIDDAVTWETYSERSTSPPGHSMQNVIDVLAEYLDPRARHAPLLQYIKLVHKHKIWSGSSLLDEEYINSNPSRPTQPEQLRRIAKQSGVGLSVSYFRKFDNDGGSMCPASLCVYDPKEPDAGLVGHGNKPLGL